MWEMLGATFLAENAASVMAAMVEALTVIAIQVTEISAAP